jgi:hypothetical protein
VTEPEFFKALERELAAAPSAEIKTYLRWHMAKEGLAVPFDRRS